MLTIETAGVKIRIENRFEDILHLCREYIVPDAERPDLTVRITEEDLKREMEKAPSWFSGEGYTECVVAYEKISEKLVDFDAFVLHASVVAVDGRAYAFAAESGVGKSTHTKYWREVLGEHLTIINGDKPICRFMPGNRLMAYGTPWNGKEKWGERISAPLEALCLLERDEENAVYPITSPAFNELWIHFHMADSHRPDMSKLIRLMDRMLKTVPVWRLCCRNDISAAELAIRTLIPERGRTLPKGRKTDETET